MNPVRTVVGALLLAIAMPAAAQETVQRCVTADGGMIYSDRSCAAFDAKPAPLRPAEARFGESMPATMGEAGAVGGFAIRGCARSPEALRVGVLGALQARDVNRLANFYHWPGTGSSSAEHLMNRLERITDQPPAAVDLVSASDHADRSLALPGPIGAGTAAAPDPRSDDHGWWSDFSPAAPSTRVLADGVPVDAGEAAADSTALPAPRPIGLRVVPASVPGDDASPTVFSLRRNAGCWWIAF